MIASQNILDLFKLREHFLDAFVAQTGHRLERVAAALRANAQAVQVFGLRVVRQPLSLAHHRSHDRGRQLGGGRREWYIALDRDWDWRREPHGHRLVALGLQRCGELIDRLLALARQLFPERLQATCESRGKLAGAFARQRLDHIELAHLAGLVGYPFELAVDLARFDRGDVRREQPDDRAQTPRGNAHLVDRFGFSRFGSRDLLLQRREVKRDGAARRRAGRIGRRNGEACSLHRWAIPCAAIVRRNGLYG